MVFFVQDEQIYQKYILQPQMLEGFLPGGQIVDFCRGRQKDFSRGETVVKFHFTYSKLREKLFLAKTLIGKYQIQGPRPPLPPSDALKSCFNKFEKIFCTLYNRFKCSFKYSSPHDKYISKRVK